RSLSRSNSGIAPGKSRRASAPATKSGKASTGKLGELVASFCARARRNSSLFWTARTGVRNCVWRKYRSSSANQLPPEISERYRLSRRKKKSSSDFFHSLGQIFLMSEDER